jgi:hypothetical protein
MADQGRTEGGKFAPKSDEHRQVRSIRLTNSTWEVLGAIAQERSITRADLLEQLVEEGVISSGQQPISSREEGIEHLVEQVLADSSVTRNGRDRGAVKRGLEALLKLLS